MTNKEKKSVIDKNTNKLIDKCVITENYSLKNDEAFADVYVYNYAKPLWDGLKWIETATKEEIEEYNKSLELSYS